MYISNPQPSSRFPFAEVELVSKQPEKLTQSQTGASDTKFWSRNRFRTFR